MSRCRMVDNFAIWSAIGFKAPLKIEIQDKNIPQHISVSVDDEDVFFVESLVRSRSNTPCRCKTVSVKSIQTIWTKRSV